MFGSDLLVAPLFEKETERTVYLPPGDWIDYARHDKAEGTRWDTIPSRDIPIVVLVRAGAAIPHAGLAQSINDIDWNEIALRAFQSDKKQATAQLAAPAGALYQLNLSPRSDGEYHLENDSLMGKVRWQSKGAIK